MMNQCSERAPSGSSRPSARLAFVIAAILTAVPVRAADAQLKYVVIVTRHGVRSPTWDAARLAQYSAAPWPEWGVPRGNLTPRGRLQIKSMGKYYREWLLKERLLNPAGCQSADKITVYADRDERTIETGKALAEALLPGCGLTTGFQPGDKSDPLFSGTFSPDPEASLKAVEARLDPDLLAHHRAAVETLQAILGKNQLMEAQEVSVAIGGKSIELKGPFTAGSTLSEDLLLEYTNGMQGNDLGWGRLTREKLFQVMEIHTIYADLMRRTPYLAQKGANLLLHVGRSIEQAASGHAVEGALGKPGDALLVLAGHDTNLSNLSGLLGLSWNLPGFQPDDTPPGGALVFSLWQDRAGSQTIRLRYVAQTPDQMRNLESGPPESQDVAVPGCDPCTFTAFQRILEAHRGTSQGAQLTH